MDLKFGIIKFIVMNLQELRTFLTIVETGNLVRASAVLNVTQSTVTARLKSLEDELGQTLLIRNKSGATLTAAGLKLHRYADSIVNLWKQARQETALPQGMSGVCNLACAYDLWPNLGSDFATALMAMVPDLSVSIWLGSQTDITNWLDEGKSDLAFTYRSAFTPRQTQRSLRPDRLVLVSTDPSAPIRFDPGYVYVDGGAEFGRDHAIAYADADTARVSFGSASVALDHILRVGGSAYLPARIIADHVKHGRLFERTQAPNFERPIYVTWDKGLIAAPDWLNTLLPTIETG